MAVYIDLVMLLNFAVDYLLILGSNRLAGYRCGGIRSACAAAAGAVYAGICLLPGLTFLQSIPWRILSLVLMSLIAFGTNRSAFRRGVLFVFLSFALGGAAMGIGSNDFWSLLLCAGGVTLLCIAGMGGRINGRQYVPVEITWNDSTYSLTALQDTGNTLTDPVSGHPVLIVGSDIAWDILQLTRDQLSDPVRTLSSAPVKGLRLIPYNAVGKAGGFLLGMAMDTVKIAGTPAGRVIAFAPDVFQNGEGYQGLTGGIL